MLKHYGGMLNTFVLERIEYRGQTTIGQITFPDGRKFWTLEDTVRGWGIKDAGNTAIPLGEYHLTNSMSSRFKRVMPMVYTEDNQYEIKAGGIEFKGIRFHGGNDHTHTSGCILIALNRIELKIQGSREVEITEAISAIKASGQKAKLIIRNLAQKE